VTRVLLVGKGRPEVGGIPNFLESLLTSRLADEHELELLNLAGGDVGGRWSSANTRRAITDARRVRAAARDRDVVHVHSALAPGATLVRAGLLVLAARSRRTRVLVHAHGGRVQLWLTSALRRRVVRSSLAGAESVLAVSEGAASSLADALGARVELVENGVDTDRFRPAVDRLANDRPVILYVGVLTERKGVLDLLAASDRLVERGVDHEVHLVGGPPPDDPAAAAPVVAAAEARAGRVVLVGSVEPDGMADRYRAADVFCLPSWWEAMPLSVLEAMACGLPVVATAVGDVPRLVADGTTGRVVEPRHPDDLAAALAEVLAGDGVATGAAGRARVLERWSFDRTLDAIGRHYRGSTHSSP
jgi:glycosyltransferase involved in cell wall biosynthesis